MDVTRILEADHREVEELFDKIEKVKGAERTPFIEELKTSLLAHMELEEEILYPKMPAVTGKEPVQEGETEHDLARKALDDVLALAPSKPGFGAALDALIAGITHHVGEEEDDVFPELRSKGEKMLEEIATPFMTKRMELGMPMRADALAKASSKDELVAEAENVGIEGAADMKKDELAEALSAAMVQ